MARFDIIQYNTITLGDQDIKDLQEGNTVTVPVKKCEGKIMLRLG